MKRTQRSSSPYNSVSVENARRHKVYVQSTSCIFVSSISVRSSQHVGPRRYDAGGEEGSAGRSATASPTAVGE
jgi:hypothetical protein